MVLVPMLDLPALAVTAEPLIIDNKTIDTSNGNPTYETNKAKLDSHGMRTVGVKATPEKLLVTTNETTHGSEVNPSHEVNKLTSTSRSKTWIENDWVSLRNIALVICIAAFIIICISHFRGQKKVEKKNPPTNPSNPPLISAASKEPKKSS